MPPARLRPSPPQPLHRTFITMTCLARHTSSTGMPAHRVGVVHGGGVDGVVGADDEGEVDAVHVRVHPLSISSTMSEGTPWGGGGGEGGEAIRGVHGWASLQG